MSPYCNKCKKMFKKTGKRETLCAPCWFKTIGQSKKKDTKINLQTEEDKIKDYISPYS